MESMNWTILRISKVVFQVAISSGFDWYLAKPLGRLELRHSHEDDPPGRPPRETQDTIGSPPTFFDPIESRFCIPLPLPKPSLRAWAGAVEGSEKRGWLMGRIEAGCV